MIDGNLPIFEGVAHIAAHWMAFEQTKSPKDIRRFASVYKVDDHPARMSRTYWCICLARTLTALGYIASRLIWWFLQIVE